MRLFIGIELPEHIKCELSRVAHSLSRQAQSCRIVDTDNFHITLAFIGETQRFATVAAAMQNTAKQFVLLSDFMLPVNFELKGVGSFKSKNGHTWWIGVKPADALVELDRLLMSELDEEGFKLEHRKYVPHVTLARSVQTNTPVSLDIPDMTVNLEKISLFSSDLSGNAPRYLIRDEAYL